MSNCSDLRIRKRIRAGGGYAFTLIELLVVITLVGVLLAILLPALSEARQLRSRTICLSNLHQVGIGLANYSVEAFDALPTHYRGSLPIDTVAMGALDMGAVNLGLIVPYMSDGQVFYCPTQTEDVSPDLAYDSPANPWPPPQVPPAGGPGGPGGPPNQPGPPDQFAAPNSSYATRPFTGHISVQPHWRLSNYNSQTIYTDFLGVDGWEGPGRFNSPLHAPHRGRGYNRLFGDGAARWTDAEPLENARPIGSVMPTEAQLQAYFELMDILP